MQRQQGIKRPQLAFCVPTRLRHIVQIRQNTYHRNVNPIQHLKAFLSLHVDTLHLGRLLRKTVPPIILHHTRHLIIDKGLVGNHDLFIQSNDELQE